MKMRNVLMGLVAALVTVAVWTASASADIVYLRDGRKFEGKILRETPDYIMIDTVIATIRTQLRLDRSNIESIQRKALPDGFFEKEDKKDDETSKPDEKKDDEKEEEETLGPKLAPVNPDLDDDMHYFARVDERVFRSLKYEGKEPEQSANYYLEIPLEGGFGEDIWPAGIKKSLEYAKDKGIKHVVFRIDSPGGYVWAADEIKEIMMDYKHDFTIHCVIEQAISASIWVVFTSDRIYMTEGSAVGGATVYHMSSFGHAAVDAKMVSITAAKLTSIAEARGHPADLVAPMVVMEESVYGYRDKDGKVHISKAKPNEIGADDIIVQDGPKQVLTLSRGKAVELGLASAVDRGVRDVGMLNGLRDWKPYSDAGKIFMRDSKNLSKRLVKQAEELREKYGQYHVATMQRIGEADAVDPRKTVELVYYQHNGQLTPNCIREWRRASERCMAAWMKVQEGLEEWRKVSDELDKMGIDPPISDFNLKEVIDQAQREIDWLRKNRIRTHR